MFIKPKPRKYTCKTVNTSLKNNVTVIGKHTLRDSNVVFEIHVRCFISVLVCGLNFINSFYFKLILAKISLYFLVENDSIPTRPNKIFIIRIKRRK